MKKRLLSLLLAVCTAVSLLAVPAAAEGSSRRFADIADSATATNAEVLRLMGVMDGYGDGSFRPDVTLNRAQFCKMATYAMNAQDRLGLYRAVTVFPDVKPSHWAAAFINLASRTKVGEQGSPIIAGFPDGKFHPERTINLGQAAAILLRMLGYQESEIGGVWPDSFLATASVAGLLEGVPVNGYAPVSRAQAAQLFVNLLRAEKPGGGTLYAIGEEEVSLDAVDGGRGVVKYAGTKELAMAHPITDSALVGMTGHLVTAENGKLLTFLPETGSGSGSAAGAVVLYSSQSEAALSALAGNNSYQIYKNGTSAGVGDLRKYDVATYYPATNSILVCDTRLSVYYEDAEPSPKAPSSIKVLGGTEFSVLPAARDSLSAFKPGDRMVLLLTADGRVAGAVSAEETRGNALGYVNGEGTVTLFVGNTTKELACKADEKSFGQVVRISSTQKDTASFVQPGGGPTGDLDVQARTMGSKRLAENVMIFDNGSQTTLDRLDRKVIPSGQVRFAHTNWAGQVDIVVLERATDEIFGRVVITLEHHDAVPPVEGDPGKDAYDDQFITIEYGNEKRVGPIKSDSLVRNGEYVAVKLNADKTMFTYLDRLTEIRNVATTAWTGKRLVQAGGRTYEVPEDVLCFNANSETWISLDKALQYSDHTDLYVKDGMVRVVEVR